MDRHILGMSAVVGITVLIAVDYALALQRQETDRLVAALFEDGAVEQGVVYESLNFAALHRLPVLFICENNGYAIHAPLPKPWATRRLCERVETFGLPARQVRDSDIFMLWRTLAALAARSLFTNQMDWKRRV